ncbi:MAG: HD domain-containing protein [Gammaproteobacteria bacterium]
MTDTSPYERIHDLYRKFGTGHYGERVTQIQHAVQCGRLALDDGYDDEVVIAAFLHDIGHLLVEELPPERREGAILRHQEVGADFLRELEFSERVAKLVETHVDGKRYLTAVQEGYWQDLSEASKESLGFQGGPMSVTEVSVFEADPDLDQHLALRRWDDLAKDPENADVDIAPFMDRIRAHLG